MAPIKLVIAKIFDQFVPNKSPGVNPEICRALVKDFLTAFQRHMPLLNTKQLKHSAVLHSALAC
jgi:hypothetical protein